MNKKNIREISLAEIQDFILTSNEKPFRAKQIYEWLWKKSAHSFAEMSNIPQALRELLEEHFVINAIQICATSISTDKTIKYAFKLFDSTIVEGVLIPSGHGVTACVSSQVGCNFSCRFCATGKLGWTRNLLFDEIFDQVAMLNQESIKNFGSGLSNIVFMGMGEPLLNYDHVLLAIEKITSPEGMGVSPRRITVSTVGVTKMIKQLGDDRVKFNLALSLHAANDVKRSTIMPANEQNSLTKLAEAIKHFHAKTNSRITFEYLLLKDFNDSMQDAKELAEFCKNVPCKINIIEYNPIERSPYKKSDKDATSRFVEFLLSKNLIVNVRISKGKDINAACGQLAYKLKTEKK